MSLSNDMGQPYWPRRKRYLRAVRAMWAVMLGRMTAREAHWWVWYGEA